MKIVTTVDEVRDIVGQWRKDGLTIGFVPTMGYLHEGHMSLMQKSINGNDKTVASIFVNPMQFGPTEDLGTYPRDFQRDKEMCENLGIDLIFHPDVSEMYDDGFCSYINMSKVTETLCGASRPVFYKGVCTVVGKLFNIVRPDKAYFGEKDAQQLLVIKRMVKDLNFGVEIIGGEIIREPDGLAKSSRNAYLDESQRKAALILNKALTAGKEKFFAGERNSTTLKAYIRDIINTEPMAEVEYVEAVDWNNAQTILTLDKPFLMAIAVRIGKVRLIDNFIIK
ncbi:MAG: pantoate--beta-alanine ligase [Anaerovoracaceae bacterium]